VILVTTADAVEHYAKDPPPDPAPTIELVDVDVPLPPPPPPPPKLDDPKPPPPVTERVATPLPVHHETVPPPPTNEPPPTDVAASGGAEIVRMDDIAPSAHGVAIATGKPALHIGRGGNGGGIGAGSGAGTADEPPKPVSVATIKTRAMPRGDYSYFDAAKEYPEEAKTLAIEGAIRVRLIVDESGKVKSSVLLNRLGHGLDELALRRAQVIEFDPAKDSDDKPVSSVVVWTFNMTLPK